MSRLILTRMAKADLADIYDFIHVRNADAAQRLHAEMIEVLSLLAQQPLIGQSRSDLRGDLRFFPVAKYLIFYRLRADAVEIVRVLHSARDLPSILSD